MKIKILNAGLELWPDVTLQGVANLIGGITRQGVNHHFPDGSLKDAVALHAVNTGHGRIIVQLIALDHVVVDDMTQGEREGHFNALHGCESYLKDY